VPDMLDILRDEIVRNGPMTFARYMGFALYHPAGGYYTGAGTGLSHLAGRETSLPVRMFTHSGDGVWLASCTRCGNFWGSHLSFVCWRLVEGAACLARKSGDMRATRRQTGRRALR